MLRSTSNPVQVGIPVTNTSTVYMSPQNYNDPNIYNQNGIPVIVEERRKSSNKFCESICAFFACILCCFLVFDN